MFKSKYGKKVVKAVVLHQTYSVCKWWKRRRPWMKVRPYRCTNNHSGSARLMESASGVSGVKELNESGTPVEILEGDNLKTEE